MNSQSFFSTQNLKLAAALSAAGFEVFSVEKIQVGARETVLVELASEHNGHKAQELATRFEEYGKSPHARAIEEIVTARGVTPAEQTLIIFDAARTAGHNRVVLLKVAPDQPLKQINIGGGRLLQFRAGTPRETLKKLCR
jgi:hypothetical protein